MSLTMKTTVDDAVVEYMRVNNLSGKNQDEMPLPTLATGQSIDSVRADMGD